MSGNGLAASSSGRPVTGSAGGGADRLLEVRGLQKRYPSGVVANDGIDLEIGRGDVFGLLGPNGAGKTTLVRQIVGLLCPSGGSIVLDGTDLVADPAAARRLVSYLPQGTPPIDSLTPRQAAELVGRIRGGARGAVRRRAAELFEALEMEEWTDSLTVRLSGGVKRLVGFVMAAVQPASLMILDEPTNDVDPLRRRLLWRQIRRLGRSGVSVLLVTHNVLEAEQSVDRLAVIDAGTIIAQGTPSALKADDRGSMRLQLGLVPGAATPELPVVVKNHSRIGRRVFGLVDEIDATEAIRWARDRVADGTVEEYALGATTLEDVYIRLIGRADALEERQEAR